MRIASYANFHFRQTLQRYFLAEGQATLRKISSTIAEK